MNPIDESKGTTPLDPSESAGLLLTHITTRGELNRWEQNNLLEAVEWLELARPTDILNEGFARELHEKMFGRVWKWAGKFRKTDRNLGVPWPRIAGRHSRLMADLYLTNILRCPRLTWGGNRLAAKGDVRRRYIAALQAADRSDYGPLLDFARS
jgi:fido (protein-threonine AMPylation protein)